MQDNTSSQNCKLDGTPTKRRKLNEYSCNDELIQLGLPLTRKKSLIQNFHFIGAINRKDSKLSMIRKQSTNRPGINLSEFNQFDLLGRNNSKQQINIGYMDNQDSQSASSEDGNQKISAKQIKLLKRATMLNTANYDMAPRLFRCNSGIQIEESINVADQRKYGDNIYLQQLQRKNTKQKQNISKFANKSMNKTFKNNYNRKAYQQDSDQQIQNNIQERLLKDYQISSNLHAFVKNHENYLCMNKLQRIFYYIKRINFSDQYTEQKVFQLCQNQIKLYNRDDQGYMLRYYQSWQQEDCVFLVFQVASNSMQQKLEGKIKLRENQIWSLLTDCCATLTWIKKQDSIHLNIKPGNILKCRQKYKLSDPLVNSQTLSNALNMFKYDEHEQSKLKLAFSYAAPELLQFRNFMQGLDFDKCDIFSLGICLLQNITGISVNIIRRDLKTIRKNNQKYLKGYSHSLRSLIIRMTSLDPIKRPSSEEIGNLRQLQCFNMRTAKNTNDDLSSPTKPKRKMSL